MVVTVLVILKNLLIWKHILTSQRYMQLRVSPDKLKLHSCVTTVRWKERKWTVSYIFSNEQSDKVRSNYLTKCKRNAKIARYHKKQCASVKMLRKNYELFGALLVPNILEKLPNTIKLQISRKLGKENWNVEQLLSTVNQKIITSKNFDIWNKTVSIGKRKVKILLPVHYMSKQG